MSWYGAVFATVYDPFLAVGERLGMAARRRELLAGAHGSVLEIGAGTGLNLRHYPAAVTSLTVAEPEAPMLRRLSERAGAAGVEATVVLAPAEQLPFPDAQFDTVVSTLVLCTVADLPRSLGEINRVLAPGGQLLLIEHVRSATARAARWQDRLHRPWRAFAYGCNCNLDLEASLRGAEFDVAGLQHARWQGMPSIVKPLVVGRSQVASRV